MKYNDNGEYKDIYVKTFDTLPVGAEVDYDGSVVPDGWTEVDEVETGTIPITSSSVSAGDITYAKCGNIVNIDVNNIRISQGTSSAYQAILLAQLPEKLKPILRAKTLVHRNETNQLYILGVSTTTNNIYIYNTTSGVTADVNKAIEGMLTYITAE